MGNQRPGHSDFAAPRAGRASRLGRLRVAGRGHMTRRRTRRVSGRDSPSTPGSPASHGVGSRPRARPPRRAVPRPEEPAGSRVVLIHARRGPASARAEPSLRPGSCRAKGPPSQQTTDPPLSAGQQTTHCRQAIYSDETWNPNRFIHQNKSPADHTLPAGAATLRRRRRDRAPDARRAAGG